MSDTPLQNLSELEAALRAAGLTPGAYRTLLGRVRRFLGRYADLETRLLGRVEAVVPAHLLALDLPEDPLEAAELLAERERARLDLGEGEVGDMMTLLDRETLKVYRPPFPAGALDGFFLFDGDVGPALVVDGNLPPAESDYVFARLYAHYLMDNDPYRIQLAFSGRPAGADPVELRAQAFAGAFLVSRLGIARYLDALGWKRGDPVTAEVVRHLAVYFEVSPRTLLARLLSLRLTSPAEVPALVRALEESGEGESEPSPPPSPVPERFVRLALEAHARKEIGDRELARDLETDLAGARRLAARFHLEPEAPPGARRPSRPRGKRLPGPADPPDGNGGREDKESS